MNSKQQEFHYRVIQAYRSAYPDPITFSQGTPLRIGQAYAGSEDWPNWLWCSVAGHAAGWVPEQIIERLDAHNGVALADYSAQELDVDVGDELLGQRVLNGWAWCLHVARQAAGWVPLQCLQAVPDCA